MLELPIEVTTNIPKITITGFDQIMIENYMGIIEYEEYGRTMYMWYYNDLKSNKRGDCLSYSVDVPE